MRKTGKRKALYEPVHGSAPDIAGKGIANPIAMIASFAMCLRYSFNMVAEADRLEKAIAAVLDEGIRTGDIMSAGMTRSAPSRWARRSSRRVPGPVGLTPGLCAGPAWRYAWVPPAASAGAQAGQVIGSHEFFRQGR